MTLTTDMVYERLRRVLDPETRLSIVAMGLIYDVLITASPDARPQVTIVYTLTTPGCPLASVIARMMWDEFRDLEPQGLVPERDIRLDLTFDPPWTIDHMDEESRAALGFL